MFAIFNPPAGAKYGKKAKGKGKGKSPYNMFVSKYYDTHPGATMSEAASAWNARDGKIHKHHKARAKFHKGKPRNYVSKKALTGIVGSAVKANVCNLTALQRARQKYCGVGAKSGIASLEKFRSVDAGDRLVSAAEKGYRAVANNSGRSSMKRGRKGGFSPMKFKVGDYVSMNPPQVQQAYAGALSGVQPKNVTGITPILGGYIANALFTSAMSKFIPYTNAGAGSYLLGLVNSGLLGLAAKHFVGAEFARGMVVGARAEPIVRALKDISTGGLSALSLKGWDEDGLSERFGASGKFEDRPGALQDNIRGQPFLGDFTTPGQVGSAQPTESSTSQYSLPAAGAQAPTPQQTMQAYENDAVAAAMDSGGM